MKRLKVLGFFAAIVGAGVTIYTNWLDDKKMEETIAEKVNEALAEKEKNEEEIDEES